MKKLLKASAKYSICTFGLTVLAYIAVPATAQTQMLYPKKPYSATLEVTQNGVTTPAKMYISGSKLRMDMIAPNGTSGNMKTIFVADRETGDAFTLTEMGGKKIAIKIPGNQAMNKIGFAFNKLGPKLGKKRIGFFKHCTNYKTSTGTTCLTKNNIVYEAYDDERYMRVKKVKIGKQNPALFLIPPGYQIMDLGGMMGGLGGLGNMGDISAMGNIGNMGSLNDMLKLGTALTKPENQSGEGLNQLLESFGLPQGVIGAQSSGGNGAKSSDNGHSFAGVLQGLIKNQVKGSGAEGLLDGSMQKTDAYRDALRQRQQILDDVKNGVDPLERIIKQQGLSSEDLKKFRGAMGEVNRKSAALPTNDQMAAKFEESYDPIKNQTARFEAATKRAQALIDSGQMTKAKAAEFAREIEAIEKSMIDAFGGQKK